MSQHHFWRYTACFLLSLTVLLAYCGQRVSPSVPLDSLAFYIAADANHLSVLTWQRVGQDELQGEWVSRGMPDLEQLIQPKTMKTLWSGKIEDATTISLTVSGSLLEGKVEGQQLRMTGTNAEGDFQGALWYKISGEQAGQYTAAFDAYAQARLAFAVLKQTVVFPPLDSSEYWYAGSVGSAEQYVSGLGEKQEKLKRLADVCGSGLLAQFWLEYPPDASEFVLSPWEKVGKTAQENAAGVIEQTTLWKQKEEYEGAWSAAGGKQIPKVEGVPLSWRNSPDEKEGTAESVEQQAQKMLSDLQTVLKADYETMKGLKEEAWQIGSEVEQRATLQGCPRGG